MLASTHGVQVYHPSPDDYWRWTHAGLERLFRENGDWRSVTVTPGAGTTACLAMLLAIYVDLALARAHLRRLAPPADRGAQPAAEALDRARPVAARAAARDAVRELPRRRRGAAMSKVLVTGGAGFIGSNLVRALLERGDEVRVLDNFSTGNRAQPRGLSDVEVVEGELRSYERVHNAVRGVEVVFHLGALGSVPRSVQDPLTSSAVNVEGTLNVLLAARDEGVRRVVFASSSSVYGNARRAAARPRRRRPIRSRRTASRSSRPSATASASAASTALETVVLRYFNVFGPRQDPTLAVRGRRAALHHRDRGRRAGHDLRRRRAVARLHLRRQRRRREPARRRERRRRRGVFNVAAGRPATVNELADTIGAALGKAVEKEYLPAGPATSATRGPLWRAREVLGYEPRSGSRRACGGPPTRC